MKICHVTEYCHASGYGGTERYVLELIRALEPLGWRNTIGWLCSEKDLRPFTLDGVRIAPVCSIGSRVDPLDRMFEPNAMRTIFRDEQPDFIHFHTFGRAEAAIARLAVEQGVPYAFTYHGPALTCRRETLLRWGKVVCDGEVRTLRCAACKLQERLGVSPLVAYAGMCLSALPGVLLGRLAAGKLRRRSAFIADTGRFRADLREFLSRCALVVSCCEWSTPLLVLNAASREHVFFCPQGVPMDFAGAKQRLEKAGSGKTVPDEGLFVVGYVGRLSPIKGIHLLVDAFTRTPYPAARLRIYGWSPHDSVRQYTHAVMKKASRDPRISFLPKLPFERMVEAYGRLSLLAIPSVCMETGPLVLFEALQMGVPVFGCDRVGQLDVLRRHGAVVTPNTAGEWESALNRAFEAHRNGKRLAEAFGFQEPGPDAVRTMSQAAVEMDAAYRRVCQPGEPG